MKRLTRLHTPKAAGAATDWSLELRFQAEAHKQTAEIYLVKSKSKFLPKNLNHFKNQLLNGWFNPFHIL